MELPRLRRLDGRGAVLITGLSIAPAIAVLAKVRDTRPDELVPAVGLVSYALVLGAAILTYFHWRMISISGADELSARLAAWLTVGLTAAGVDGLLQVAPFDVGPGGNPDQWSMVCQLVILLLLCVAAALAERVEIPADPALVGALTAVLITAANVVSLMVAPPLVLTATASALLNTAVMVAGLLLVWVVLHRTQVSIWARRRLALAAVLLTGAQCALNVDQHGWLLMQAVMAAFLLGALTLCTMTQQLLRRSVLQHQDELELLHQSLAEVRAAVLEDRELLHEVGATLAGISTASRVIRQEQAVPAHRRQRLESMLAAELARLERLMRARANGPGHGEDCEIDVDAVVEHLVVSHQARGRDVLWTPSGQRAIGDADELAEVLNILLENAARHGAGSLIRLSVKVVDDGVVATCSDAGPGVPPELRDRLFDPEVRRPGSPGQGLGLAIASRLVSARGGSLELIDVERPGATFLARLPRKETADDAACHVA